MKRILFIVLCLIPFAELIAQVSLELESQKVEVGQTFRISIKSNTQYNAQPDLAPLNNDFNIVGTESSISYNLINGKATSSSEWTILLKAKRSGIVLIPALKVGKELTAPTSIEVSGESFSLSPKDDTPDVNSKQQGIQIVAESSMDKPYVNQQVLYTVKLYNNNRLLDANYKPPQVEDALFVSFGAGRRYQVTKEGQLYSVEEQKFALFPQKSGQLTIKPPSFNALIYDNIPRRVSAEAKPVVLQVQAIPAQYQGKDWLPSKQVTLEESYSKGTDAVKEGDTLVRTVILKAVAVPAQLLPKLDFGQSRDYNLYQEKPTETNSFNQQDLVGSTTIKLTYLLNKSGTVTIPSLSLHWFNTQTGKEEVASLPQRTMPVGVSTKTTKPNPQSLPAAPSMKVASQASIVPQKAQSHFAWWIASAFAFAWILTLWAWYKRGRTPTERKSAAKKELRQACLRNQEKNARDALLKWAKLQWPNKSIYNLVDVENFISDAACKKEIRILDQVLYQGTKKNKQWEGKELWQCISRLKQGSRKNNKKNSLPPINPL